MYKKDFDGWCDVKLSLNLGVSKMFFHEREIWLVYMGVNVGDEQNGKGDEYLRPVVVLKKFSKNLFLGVSLTSVFRDGVFYYSFPFKGSLSTAILSQIKLFDKKRLKRHYGRMSKFEFFEMKEKLIELIQ